jgi:hypothetical protein
MNQDIHTPRHLLETLAADGDLPHAPAARMHVAGCAICRSRLAEITAARAAYLAAYPAEAFARQVAARAERGRRASAAGNDLGSNVRTAAGTARRRWLAGLGGLIFALGAVALYVLPGAHAPDEIRLKGPVGWSVFVQRGTRTWALGEGESLQSGDRLAFAYALSQDRYLVLLGIDDAGTITRYGPEGAPPLRLARGQGRIPFAIELDDRPGEEQLIALFSAAPLDVAVARQALATAATGARAQHRRLGPDDLKLPAQGVIIAFKKR